MSDKIKAVIIPGDGIGPEVAEAVQYVFNAAAVPIEWVEAHAGLTVYEAQGGGLPAETVRLVREVGLGLKGPTATPSAAGHASINVGLRKKLGLFANVRPAKSIEGIKSRYVGVDVVIVRENLEDTYAGIEYMETPEVAEGLKLISRVGAERVIRYAFEFAKREGRSKVTCVHKANIHKLTDGLFLKVFRKLREEYAELEADEMLVDNVCMQLVARPEKFDVMVMPNLYGDIVSDLCASLIGGLGVAPSGNIGKRVAVFEAVHGSAPDIAGKGLANPTALLLSGIMLLKHVGLFAHAEYIQRAMVKCLSSGMCTSDLGGDLSTMKYAESIVGNFEGEIPNSELRGQSIFIETKPLAAAQEFTSELIGLDLFVRSDTTPNPPDKLGAFTLESIANRGVSVSELGADFDRIDLYCVRYLSESAVSSAEILQLLSSLEGCGLNWVHCEKLFNIDGKRGFSQVE